MKQNSTMNHDDTIDLKELFFSLISQWKIIALCIILSLICALLYLRITPATYSTDALVQVENNKGAGSAALLGDLSSVVEQKSPAESEIEILKSRMVLGKVVDNLNLNILIKDTNDSKLQKIVRKNTEQIIYSKTQVDLKHVGANLSIVQFSIPEFYIDKPLVLDFKTDQSYSLLYQNKILFSGKLNENNEKNNSYGAFKLRINSQDNFEKSFNITMLSIPNAVQNLRAPLKVAEKGKSSGVLGLSYDGYDKTHITKVLNNILEVYHQQNIERKTLESTQTLNFLDKQLPELKQQLENSEIKFNKFREQNNTIDVTQEAQLLLTQNIELEKIKIDLKQKQAELSAKYTNDHPLMSQINAQLDEINSKTNELTQTLKRLPETQRLYLQLYRDVKVNTEQYTALLNSYQQLKVASAGEIGSVRIIDTAVEPVQPIKPQKLIVLILAIFVGGFIGVVIALLRKMLRTGIKDSAQIENELDIPVYATVPRSPIQENRIKLLKKKKNIPILAVKNTDDIAIESLRSMRTAIHFALSNAKNNIIMISGPAPEVGKSFISTNLATILAQSQKRVLLIDADLRRGYLHKYFNQDNQQGLSEYLNGQVELSSVIKSSEVEGLALISRGKSPVNPSELLSTAKFTEMLASLSTQYDHILIDTPPILAVTDGIIISQHAGVNLVIARYAKSQMKELEMTINRFEQSGVKVNGFILNDIQRSSAGYGYGYNYAYAYKASKEQD